MLCNDLDPAFCLAVLAVPSVLLKPSYDPHASALDQQPAAAVCQLAPCLNIKVRNFVLDLLARFEIPVGSYCEGAETSALLCCIKICALCEVSLNNNRV